MFAKKLLGESEIEQVLKRLDRLTQEGVRMVEAQPLMLIHTLDDKVTRIDGEVKVMVGILKAISDTVGVVHEGARYVEFLPIPL